LFDDLTFSSLAREETVQHYAFALCNKLHRRPRTSGWLDDWLLLAVLLQQLCKNNCTFTLACPVSLAAGFVQNFCIDSLDWHS
jgi:hypothetical protein